MKNKNLTVVFSVLLLFALINNLSAQNGQLDETFGYHGIVNTPINLPGYSFLTTSTLQSDGKILSAGDAVSQNHSYMAIVRYDTTGNPDFSFGVNGITFTRFGSSGDQITCIGVQSDGKIVAAGATPNGNNNNDIILVRYNPDGSSDNTFGNNGIVISAYSDSSNDIPFGIAIQNDNKIVIAGFTTDATKSYFYLGRYNPSGFPDNSFGTNGFVITSISSSYDGATSVVIQNDGKIVAAGDADNVMALVRYNQNGSLDNTFGNGGMVTILIENRDDLNSIALQNDNKIVVAGTSYDLSHSHFAMARFNSDGSPDNTFGTGGIVITSINGSHDGSRSAVIQSDGKIIAAGDSYYNNKDYFALARYTSNGNLDSTFGMNGIVTTEIGSFNDQAMSVKVQGDGKIIAAGNTGSQNDSTDFVVIRYNMDGSMDNSFGTDGFTINKLRLSQAVVNTETIQNDGKIITAGYADIYSNGLTKNNFALIRYNTDGSPDNAFGTGGIVVTSVGTSNNIVYSVTTQNDGKILAAGYSINQNNYKDLTLVRYNSEGSIDSTFGSNGSVITSLGLTANSEARSIKIQQDGKILVAGLTDVNGYDDFLVVRYNSDGSLDNSFGLNGIVTTTFGPSSIDDAYSLDLQSDGKIVLSGFSNYISYFDYALTRYNTDGSLDNSFGINGLVTTQLGTSDALAFSMKIQSDGKIIAAGSSDNGSNYDFTIVRYNSDGSLDNTFGSNGIVNTPIGTQDDGANDLALQTDGKIITAGYTVSGNKEYIALCRYDNDGQLDNTFGTGGIIVTTNGITSDDANSVILQSDGKIIAGGYSTNGNYYSVFTLTRYNTNAQTGIGQEGRTSPLSFELMQNYPNPFNPSTRIKYSIPNNEFVTLKLYDILGREIRSLVEEQESPGNYEIEFIAKNLTSGVYFYKMQAGPFSQIRKMILLK